MQRPLNSASPLHPRNGAPKRTQTEFASAEPAMEGRQNYAPNHPLLPGAKRPLDDEPMQKTFANGKSEPIHPGMKSSRERGEDRGRDHGCAVLKEAQNLGRKA